MDNTFEKMLALALVILFSGIIGGVILENIVEYKVKMAAIAVADKAVEKGVSLRFDGDIFKGLVIERK